MLMNLYINGTGLISAAGSNTDADFLYNVPEYDTNQLLCKEPDYAAFIPAMQLRRMSKAVRMGVAASKICFSQASIEKPDALSIGTAMGCLYDTEQFLKKMVVQNEQQLTPTAFIQSTHNTVAGQIALLCGCNGHNLTYTHRAHSFEHALINAKLYLDDHAGEQVLCGGIDELIEPSRHLMQRAGVYAASNRSAKDVVGTYAQGSVAGEGASFFLLNAAPVKGTLCIKDISVFSTKDKAAAVNNMAQYLNDIAGSIDLVMLGVNGDENSREFYEPLKNGVFAGVPQAAFKQLCGEYATSSAFALGLLSHAVTSGEVPSSVILNNQPKALRRVLIVNHFLHYYSCILVELA